MFTILSVLGAIVLAQSSDLQTTEVNGAGSSQPTEQGLPPPGTIVNAPSTGTSPNPVPAVASPNLGKIVMFRPATLLGAGIACPIRFKGQEIVELGRGKYAEWHVPAGRYILNNKTASVEVHVEPGEARYVRCMIKPGFLTGRADLQIVDQESFGDGAERYPRKEVVDPLVRQSTN